MRFGLGLSLGLHRQRARSAPLDAFAASLYVAFGMRRLVSTWSGPLVTVRRSSDNATLDAYPSGDGWLDTAALLAWCGTASAYVTRWWDQSGSGRHADQTTASAQPMLVNAGVLITLGDKIAIRNDAYKYFVCVSSTSIIQPMSIATTIRCLDYSMSLSQVIAVGGISFYINTAGRLNYYSAGYSIPSSLLTDNKPYFFAVSLNGNSSYIYSSSSIVYGDAGSTTLGSTVYLFASSSNNASAVTGEIGEFLIFNKYINPTEMYNINNKLMLDRGLSA